jgi:ubiquinone biosynthesis protein UbiJ
MTLKDQVSKLNQQVARLTEAPLSIQVSPEEEARWREIIERTREIQEQLTAVQIGTYLDLSPTFKDIRQRLLDKINCCIDEIIVTDPRSIEALSSLSKLVIMLEQASINLILPFYVQPGAMPGAADNPNAKSNTVQVMFS